MFVSVGFLHNSIIRMYCSFILPAVIEKKRILCQEDKLYVEINVYLGI